MSIMTNADAFLYDFGIYATELWAMTEAQFLEWLNATCDRERPRDMIVRCKDCRHLKQEFQWNGMPYKTCEFHGNGFPDDWYCADGERKDK